METNKSLPVFEKEFTFRASVDELEKLLDCMADIFAEYSCPEKTCNQIAVITEEIFVNIARYAYDEKPGDAVVRVGRAGPVMAIQFVDTGKHFNPLEKTAPDINASIENRAIGGLGIYIAKKWMDSIHYERVDGENRLTLQKNIAA
ncbi:MAG: ATP-binding protein [Spirochaetaceae bacterium]|jgi:sigma-B regulation protein RsbU (phosphoserine phosphatase)|nr:ATP-binding protein [Spirochaetaceae bacterium]